MSFGLYLDAGLSTPAGTLTTDHLTDGSTDPVDVPVWFGAPESGTQIEDATAPGVASVVVQLVASVPAWQASHAYAAGARVVPVSANNRVYQAGGAGTSAASAPTWPTTVGATVTDGGVTWTCIAYQDSPAEYALALTQAGLDTATPGASLAIGTSVPGGTENAVSFWLRCIDADAVVQTQSHVDMVVGNVQETAA